MPRRTIPATRSRVVRHHDLTAPQGVRGRTSDNSFVLEQLGWEPTTSLAEGLRRTYEWIEQHVSPATTAAEMTDDIGLRRFATRRLRRWLVTP